MNESTTFSYETAFGRLDFSVDSPFWISEIDGASSVDIDIYQNRAAGQVGASISGQSVQGRVLPITGSISDPVEDNRKMLIAAIPPMIPGTFTAHRGGESWFLDVVPEKSPDITPGNGLQFFQMRLFAAYPYWRSQADNNQMLAGLVAMFEFPWDSGGEWWISQFIAGFAYVDNENNVEVPFKVVFEARHIAGYPKLYNVDTGRHIFINKEMEQGERIIVSTIPGERGVTIEAPDGTLSNGFKYLSLDSDLLMQVRPGRNIFDVTAGLNDFNIDTYIHVPEGVRSGI